MNKITRQTDIPVEFNILIDEFLCDSYKKHRRSSNFFTRSIVEINERWFPELDRSLDGFWETNDYISDSEEGMDKVDIKELNRVEKVTIMVPTTEWQLVKDDTGTM